MAIHISVAAFAYAKPLSPSQQSTSSSTSHSSLHPFSSSLSLRHRRRTHQASTLSFISPSLHHASNSFQPLVLASAKRDPLKVMISGAPASGKGTQCELITKKYGLVHVAAGDLLRAEVAAGTKNGRLAKEYMNEGNLVPDEIVVSMVKDRLSQPDSRENGWLLDGYPRSFSQATALKELVFEPDLFILLEVPEEILVERVVGRRLDPVTGKIYHMKFSPPENEEIAARLTQCFDDTEEKVKLRLRTHRQYVDAVHSLYEKIIVKIDGNVSKEDVFAQIDGALTKLLEKKSAASEHLA